MAPRNGRLGPVQELVDWLESERSRRAAAARALSLPLSVAERIPIVIVKDEKSWEGRLKPIKVSAAAVFELAMPIAEEADRIAPPPDSPAALLFDTYGARCRLWSPLTQPNFETDPVGLIDRILLKRLLAEYFRSLESLGTGSPDTAERLAGGLLDLIESERIVYVTALPIAGIRFREDPFDEGDVRFRTLTPEELGRLGDWRLLDLQ